MGPCAKKRKKNQRPGENSPGPGPRILSLGKSSALLAALGGLLGSLLGRLFLGCFFSGLSFLFRFLRRRFFSALGRRFFLRRGFRRPERRLRSARRPRALGDDQFLFGFLFDH